MNNHQASGQRPRAESVTRVRKAAKNCIIGAWCFFAAAVALTITRYTGARLSGDDPTNAEEIVIGVNGALGFALWGVMLLGAALLGALADILDDRNAGDD